MPLLNNYDGELESAEFAYIERHRQDMDAVLSANKVLSVHRKLPERPPDSFIPSWVKRRLNDHLQNHDDSRRTRNVLLTYNLIPAGRAGRRPAASNTVEARVNRKRSQTRAWHRRHREHLAEYNRARRRDIKAKLQRLKDLEALALSHGKPTVE